MHVHNKSCKYIFTKTLTTKIRSNTNTYQPMTEQTIKHLKKNDLLLYATTGMNLKNAMSKNKDTTHKRIWYQSPKVADKLALQYCEE